LEKHLKSLAQYRAENRPEATAHGARRPATRGLLKRRLGHGLATQPNGATGLRGLLQRARDGAVACSPAARRWQGVAGDLEGVTGKVPGKEERAGVHRNGGSTVRRRKQRRAAVFVGGEGAPVGVGSCSTGEARG
jgi:hypothetical protein